MCCCSCMERPARRLSSRTDDAWTTPGDALICCEIGAGGWTQDGLRMVAMRRAQIGLWK